MRTLATSLIVLPLVFGAGPSTAAPGDRDPSFGDGGKVITDVPGKHSGANDVVVLADGRIVVAGNASDFSTQQFMLARYQPDGTPDPTFGSGGIVMTSLGASSSANALLVQDDGKILAGGVTFSGSSSSFMVARYDESGILDPAFGTGGIVTTTFGTNAEIFDMKLQSDGFVVAAGRSASPNAVALARYDTDGILDPTFGDAGTRTTAIGAISTASSLLMLPSDAFVISGNSDQRLLLARYDADADLDPTFGSGGVVTTESAAGSFSARSIASMADGRLVVVGQLAGQFAVARYTASGSLDPTFAAAGIMALEPGMWPSFGRDVVVEPSGAVLAVGYATGPVPHAQTSSAMLLLRLTSDGALDPGFGNDGKVGDWFDDETLPRAMFATGDGFLIVAGTVGFNNFGSYSFDAYVARYDVRICGNSVAESGEQCDDGNLVDGDGCDSNCTPTACGNGIATAGEDCDSTDCCTPGCEFSASGTACDDGDACTGPDTCEEGTCVAPAVECPACHFCQGGSGACIEGVKPGCRRSSEIRSSKLLMVSSADPERRRITWKWNRGAETFLDDFGDPQTSTDYDICLFDDSLGSATALWTAHIPAGAGWESTRRGFGFDDPAGSFQGIDRLSLQAGEEGRTRFSLNAKRENLDDPDFLFQSPPFAIQVENSEGACWLAVFPNSGNQSEGSTVRKVKLIGR